MKVCKLFGMWASILGVILFTIRFELFCWQYTQLYNLIVNIDYWLPVLIFIGLTIYFYLSIENARGDKKCK